jgi:putative peptide zinc metalloprotease protein
MDTGHALLSANWYRIANLKPRLRGHAHIHRHVYRGGVWYVVEDKLAGRYHRFNPASYKVISLLNGRRDMQTIWELIMQELADQTPTQDAIVALLGQLYSNDLIQCDVKPDLAELFERRDKQQKRLWWSRLANPMSLRIPLFDPDRLLTRFVKWLPWLGNRWGLGLWLVVVLPALLLMPSHWAELTENFGEQLLSLDNLFFMVVLFPIVKLLHEFGHGVACKLRGGAVHELGIMILVFFPAPYVDASSSSALVNKWQRLLVGAAGMLTEMFIAALAFYFWLLLEPGLVRSLLYNVMVLASVTTLLFNANPLLRYDGYYMFVDWLESPNFANRATRYWQYLLQRHLLNNVFVEEPPHEAGEKRWFLVYEPLAFCYRLFVVFSIALFVTQQYFFLGVLIGCWGLFASLVLPIAKGCYQLFKGAGVAYSSTRASMISGGVLVFLLLWLWVIPMPHHTVAEGVFWPPEHAIIRAETGGFVDAVLVVAGTELQYGEAVLKSQDPELDAKESAQRSRVEEVQAQFDAAWGDDPAQALQLRETLNHEKAALMRVLDEREKLVLHSHANGRFLIHEPADLQGRWLAKGDLVGYVQNEEPLRIRVVVDQDHIDEVRIATKGVRIKLPQALSEDWTAKMIREVPAADKALPSSALSQQGGGDIVLDPQDEKGVKTLQSYFEFELLPQANIPYQFLGSRVYVRFEHPMEAVGFRWWRSLRRLFLSQFLI